jgi:hypothetical protein
LLCNFVFEPVSLPDPLAAFADGAFISAAPVMAPGSRVDIEGNSRNEGARALIWEATTGLNQRFSLIRIGADAAARYLITSLSSGLVLTASGSSVTQTARLSTPSPSQLWRGVAEPGGTMLISDTGLALTMSNSELVAAPPQESLAQAFTIAAVPPLAAGTYHLYTPAGNRLDVSGSSTAAGANVLLWSATTGFNQIFKLDVTLGGATSIIASHSSKALSIEGAQATPGANVVQANHVLNAPSQVFSLVPADSGWFVLKSNLGTWLATNADTAGSNVFSTTNEAAALRLRFEPVARYSTGIAELDVKLDWIRNNRIGLSGDVLRASYNYVVGNYSYRSGSLYPSGDWAAPFALEMINYGSGNCYRYAALFCILARSYGYEAWVVSGYVPSVSGGWAPHGWVEVRVNGTVYLCDPDLAYALPRYNWYMVTYGQAPTTYRR